MENSLAGVGGGSLVDAERSPMPAWPKSILSFGADLLTARTALGLRRRDRAASGQRRAFRTLTGSLAATSYWRDAGVRAAMSYEEFRQRVLPRGYEALVPAITRMQAGEPNVLWPGACAFFVKSAGTTTGEGKVLPATPATLEHLRRSCRDALLYYTARAGHAGVVRGRGLFLTGSTALEPLGDAATPRAYVGEWPAIAALNLPRWVEQCACEPGAEIAAMRDWQAKIEATIARTMDCDVSLLAGLPTWVLSFAEALAARPSPEGAPIGMLQNLWPNLECLIHGGVALTPYQDELRQLLGPDVAFHEVYATAEGFIAAQDTAAAGELRLMTGNGLFFEFVPLADFDEARPEAWAPKALTIAEVKVGVDYALVVTTPAGLARYPVGDVVRFSSLEPPRLECVGRTRRLTAFGEGVLDKQVTDALQVVCKRHRWRVVNFHVAPQCESSLTGQPRGRHEWWIELKPGTVETPTGPQMAIELDAELQRLAPEYGARRRAGRIDPPTVRLVMPGVFRHWLEFHGRWGGQTKVARCRNDRRIADELLQITRFARDS
ncbi:GH3 auxin-responsive promoter family protein [Opitutus sp. ER46]|uniref:GH3 family domain-containing protein n=1 Tax=Opitutus sp. ER46 TaxID=2161864 RepID=UPI000D323D95|nr:GH3 auxin-responsive promoter family protein [Opitutus sp. ER46]PTY01168.1 hypothetical protein DB354_00555 [Opitutus sp. ER46]